NSIEKARPGPGGALCLELIAQKEQDEDQEDEERIVVAVQLHRPLPPLRPEGTSGTPYGPAVGLAIGRGAHPCPRAVRRRAGRGLDQAAQVLLRVPREEVDQGHLQQGVGARRLLEASPER